MTSKSIISTIKGDYVRRTRLETFEVQQQAEPIVHWYFWFVRPDGTESDQGQADTESEAIRLANNRIASDASHDG